jgi:hypothetical protein
MALSFSLPVGRFLGIVGYSWVRGAVSVLPATSLAPLEPFAETRLPQSSAPPA